MTTRLLEVILPGDQKHEVEQLLEGMNHVGVWYIQLSSGNILVRILSISEDIEEIIDKLSNRFSGESSFRIIIHAIDATIPHPEEADGKSEDYEKNEVNVEKNTKYGQVTREELYEEAIENVKLTRVYIALVILSSIVAVIGVLYNSTAIIIGAMVIAPMLGPNIALSLSAALGDLKLAVKALESNGFGIGITFLISLIVGSLVPVDPSINEIATRTDVGYGHLILALAAGGAGVLSITTGVSAAIVGVMVAVALLPPLVVFGLLLGSGHQIIAFQSLLLFLVNLIAVNLAGVITFSVQGVRPGKWSEIDGAKKTTNYALAIWIILIMLMAFIISISQEW
ncbi:TIGR00341 family protein [Methanolobus sp.]|uniref:TIGR00341 family protein n=1 Tax=Methanolobus sp. TaxID=1874737 RepID=UPI0025F61112|nr:TIGR00341 family protein [Methanolobus sp.]